MKLVHKSVRLEIPDDDPRVERILAIVLDQEPNLSLLWNVITPEHRQLLFAVYTAGDLSGIDLAKKLKKNKYELRGLLTAIAKITTREGLAHPLVVTGNRPKFYKINPKYKQLFKNKI